MRLIGNQYRTRWIHCSNRSQLIGNSLINSTLYLINHRSHSRCVGWKFLRRSDLLIINYRYMIRLYIKRSHSSFYMNISRISILIWGNKKISDFIRRQQTYWQRSSRLLSVCVWLLSLWWPLRHRNDRNDDWLSLHLRLINFREYLLFWISVVFSCRLLL